MAAVEKIDKLNDIIPLQLLCGIFMSVSKLVVKLSVSSVLAHLAHWTQSYFSHIFSRPEFKVVILAASKPSWALQLIEDNKVHHQ